jgi:hypothetical protein
LDDSGPVPAILLAEVLARCLSWFTWGNAIEVDLTLTSGRNLQLPALDKGKVVDDE